MNNEQQLHEQMIKKAMALDVEIIKRNIVDLMDNDQDYASIMLDVMMEALCRKIGHDAFVEFADAI
jgi:hypothetical protein